jgi:FkbM family methyltransferase
MSEVSGGSSSKIGATAVRAAKLRLRDGIAAVLARTPSRWLEPMRRGYLSAAPGSLSHQVLGAAMRLIRYRPIDPSVSAFEIAGGSGLRLTNCASAIARNLYWLGVDGWEPSELEWWTRYCSRASRILELGGNIGYYTVAGAIASKGAPYTVVEPHPRSARLLRENLRLNGITNVTVLERAVVGDDQKTVELWVPKLDADEAPAMAFVQGAGEATLEALKAVVVDCVSIKDLIDGVDLLKLDIEGYEHAVLGPIIDTLLTQRPTIFVEVLDDAVSLKALLDRLIVEGGYKASAITPNGLVPIDRIVGQDLQRRLKTRDLILAAGARLP